MRVGRLLWSNDISAEYSTLDNPKFPKQMNEVSVPQDEDVVLCCVVQFSICSCFPSQVTCRRAILECALEKHTWTRWCPR